MNMMYENFRKVWCTRILAKCDVREFCQPLPLFYCQHLPPSFSILQLLFPLLHFFILHLLSPIFLVPLIFVFITHVHYNSYPSFLISHLLLRVLCHLCLVLLLLCLWRSALITIFFLFSNIFLYMIYPKASDCMAHRCTSASSSLTRVHSDVWRSLKLPAGNLNQPGTNLSNGL